MPLFINRDQIFAHQVHLLEHKLRSKEERILELETENAILHLRLAEHQLQTNAEKINQSALVKLLSNVQAVKQDLSELFAVYVSFATELEEQSKQLLEKVEQASSGLNGHRGDEFQLQDRVAALERSLEEEQERCRAERQKRKELHNMLMLQELRGNIRVHCRVRPVLHFDHVQTSGPASSEEVIHAISDDTVNVNCLKTGMPVQNKMFEFEVHGPEDSQDVVFEEVKSLLTSLLDYNVCIMAYGQTGSGKTHTMIGSQDGSGLQQEAQQGIIPKAAAELFLISEKPSESHTVEVSVMEVYNNEVFDLLAKDDHGRAVGQRRDVITTSSGTSQVTSLTYRPVCNASEVMHIISSVLKLRAHCPTLVHTDSSRSHLIVTLTISSKSPNALALMSGISGAALWEVSCINRSLSALSDVLGSLAEQRPHVPYRNSKLTHLLQDTIGDAKLLVMLCVSPTQRFITESLQSLGFGTRARQVQKTLPRRKNHTLKVK
uniref:Kinesin family member 25 n=1 Tax=Stegastes partitus TaxID=144197 RepID=A0A3B5A5G0_9TELE